MKVEIMEVERFEIDSTKELNNILNRKGLKNVSKIDFEIINTYGHIAIYINDKKDLIINKR